MPTSLSPTDFLNRFNTIVYTPITTSYGAVWHSGNLPPVVAPDSGTPTAVNPGDFGSSVEPTFAVADIPIITGESAITKIFYILHHFAMKLTRIRQGRHYYTYGTSTIKNGGTNRAALKPGLELYFDIPAVPAVGSVIDSTTLDTFLNQLYTKVQERRTDPNFAHVFVSACHTSCHGSCHGSRGRR